tara:strand:+ start:295 stop:489 length:195 start_codon:yes stop_codon:yes gene_type:complete
MKAKAKALPNFLKSRFGMKNADNPVEENAEKKFSKSSKKGHNPKEEAAEMPMMMSKGGKVKAKC